MRRFLIKALIFGCLQIFILAFIGVFNVPHASSYMYGYGIKKKLLKETDGERIILVGGSNLAMGLNSEVIKEMTGLNPINMGLHAGIGRKLIMNDAILEALQPNDLVVLCLEYDNYAEMPAKEVVWQLLRIDPSVAFDLSLSDMVDLSETGFSYIGGQLRTSIRNLLRGERSNGGSAIYNAEAFNQFGDLTSHWNLEHREGKRTINPLVVEGRYFEGALNDVSEFVQAIREAGAHVVTSFPPIWEDEYLKNKENIDALTVILSQELNLELITSAEAMAFPEAYFFDTAYHLNYRGIERRSEILGNALRAYLGRVNEPFILQE